MLLKRRGSVLISSVMILSLMGIIAGFMFKIMRNNNELSSLYNSSIDKYDMSESEEKILYGFMRKLNENIKSEDDYKNMFMQNFEIESNDKSSNLKFIVQDNKMYLTANKDNEFDREREINWNFKNGEIVLIPTYEFKDIQK
ncbi:MULTISPECIES: hypothetical protein [Clostridium]|jgi:hypothetical protein|uniref:hypothetical protein n=1 Tax=Clostridium TaxID=1485 RepID=UPI000983EB0B|nr:MULTISPECIES: hypothetical protein [Clostridium]AQR95162.1 hypothetical protein CLSAP_24760 [Clostridium saccharoperbutylacetonicum]NSB31009.1 hypothetical protein [Clostridium saccharoperbutylacetonicum]